MQTIGEKARELKGRDLHEFMVDKGINLECPSCGYDELSIISNGPNLPLHIMVLPRVHPSDMAGDSLELVGLVCENCGYVRTFTCQHIVQWKNQVPADAE